jgi:serine/threonine-protein kinase
VAAASLFYGETGSLIVRALVSRGLGDEETELEAIGAVLARTPAMDAPTELMFGAAGYLLGLGLLLDGPTATGVPASCRPDVVRTGRTVLDRLWQRLDARPAMADCAEQGYLGQAHGWAGPLLASIRWCSLTGTASPDSLAPRLDELADLGTPGPGGIRWPMHAAAPRGPFRPGWCNGTAGLLHLWLEAAALTGRSDLEALAERTAESVAIAEPVGYGLCCGAGGMAYALLAAHRQTGEQRWLSAARRLASADPASRPADPAQQSSLYAGRLGAALLVRELTAPDLASVPLFGRA